jgi:uncharacterized membrane protein YgaE (UPF0421/DUF939 family)
MKLGARIFKTGLAIILSLYLTSFFQLEPAVLAPLGAIFALQPSIYRTFQSILEQVQGNLIGATVAILLVLSLGSEPIVIGLASIIVIVIHLKLKLQNAIPLALVTLIVIMDSAANEFADLNFAIARFSLIMIGVFSAFIVNLMFVPPKYETKIFNSILESTDETIKWLKLLTRHGSQHLALKKDLKSLANKRFKIDQYYLFFKEERVYLSKNLFKKARKLVAFRNMMTSLDQANTLLKTLHHYENDLRELPFELLESVNKEIECLTEFHEHLLNRLHGKIKAKVHTVKYEEEVMVNKVRLTNSFMDYFSTAENSTIPSSFFPLLGAMINYSESLEHLNKLVNSYNSFHYDKIAADDDEG